MISKLRVAFFGWFMLAIGGSVACDPGPPTADVLHIQGTLEGPDGPTDVQFSDSRSKGEWWPCDARLTAQACVDGEFHVGVFIARPELDAVADLGGNACVVDGAPQGAYEILRSKFDDFGTAVIGEDVSAFVVVASDIDADGSADLDDGAETRAVAVVDDGTVEMSALAGFEDPFAMRLEGKAGDRDVVVEFRGPMSNPGVVAPLEPATSCVAE